jgi:hypothetical protein
LAWFENAKTGTCAAEGVCVGDLSEDTVAGIFGDMGLNSCDEVAAFGFCDSFLIGMIDETGSFASAVDMACCETCGNYDDTQCQNFDTFLAMMSGEGEEDFNCDMAAMLGYCTNPQAGPLFSSKLCCESCSTAGECADQNEFLAANAEEAGMPFSDCTGLASFGLCNDRIASFVAAIMDDGEDDDGEDDDYYIPSYYDDYYYEDDGGMPEGFGEMVCCETCTSSEWQCADHDAIMAQVGGALGVTTCAQAVGMMANLCTNDAMIATMVPDGVVWDEGLFSEICCASCEAIAPPPAPPAATITVVVPAKMTVVIAEVPAAGSSQMKVLAGGLKAALEKSLEDVGGEVTIISIGGVNVAGRRLADAEVVFEVSVTQECATATCDDETPSADDAAAFSGSIGSALTAATADTEAFSATLAESMEEAAAELVAAGEITEEEATAAASIEVTANSVEVEEAVIEDPVVAAEDTDAPTVTPATDAPTLPDAPTDDVPPADDDLESAGSAAKLSVFSAVAAFAVAMVV